MARIVHARLDADTERILSELKRPLRWSHSRIVREGIKALTSLVPPRGRPKIVGIGRFHSGKPDLGSSRKHLDGFGR